MHFTLTYDLGAEGEQRTIVENKISEILKPYKLVKKLTTFYIIYVPSTDKWDLLLSELTNLSKSIPDRFHFLMSPAMSGGIYNGVLPKEEWNSINEITNLA